MALLFTLPRSSPMDALGRIMPGGIVRFYEAGTSTPKTVYADADLTVALGPFIQAGDDGSLPIVYLDDAGTAYKVVVTTVSGQVVPNGTIDPYLTGPSSDQIGRAIYPVSDAEQSAGVQPSDFSYPAGNVLRYGADPSGSENSTSSIQRAIDVGQTVFFPTGSYLAAGLESSTGRQCFIGEGDVWINKAADGPIWTAEGRDSYFENIKFHGRAASFSGDNLVINHDNCTLLNCGSRDAAGRAVLATTGNGLRIIGTVDVYQTADQTDDGYDIEIRGGGNYSRLMSTTSSQHTGGLLIDNAGGVSITACQIGKVTVRNNGGIFAASSRINSVVLASSNCTFTGNAIAGDVVIGPDGVAIGGIAWSDTNVIQTGANFSVGSGVRDSVIHLESMQEASVNVTVDNTASVMNYITSRPVSYTPSLESSGGGASLGNGVFQYAAYTRKGRRVSVDISLLLGSSTSFGTGILRIGLPFPVGNAPNCVGPGMAFDASNFPYSLLAEASPGASYVSFYTHGVGGQVGAANPFSWASNDRLKFSLEYSV